MDVATSNNIKALLGRAITECSNSIREREAAIDDFWILLKKTKDGPSYGVHLIAEKIADSPEQESLEALDVLDKCMARCGTVFRGEVGKFRFLNELIKIVSPKYKGLHKSPLVRYRILLSMHHWVKTYSNEYKIREAYDMLKRQGIIIEDAHGNMSPILSGYTAHHQNSTATTTTAAATATTAKSESSPSTSATTNQNANTNRIFEDDEKSRLLKKLLRSKNPDDLQAANKLIKTMVKEDEKRCELQTKRSIELQTVHNNAKLLNEMLDSYRPDSVSPGELELIKELYQSCERLRPHIFQLASDTQKSEELLNLTNTNGTSNINLKHFWSLAKQFDDILEASVALGEVYEKYKSVIIHGRIITTTTTAAAAAAAATATTTASIKSQNTMPTLNEAYGGNDISYNDNGTLDCYYNDLLQMNTTTTTTTTRTNNDDLLDLTTPDTTTTTNNSALLNNDIIELNDVFNIIPSSIVTTTTTTGIGTTIAAAAVASTSTLINNDQHYNNILQPINYNTNILQPLTTTTTSTLSSLPLSISASTSSSSSSSSSSTTTTVDDIKITNAFKELNVLSEQLLKENLNKKPITINNDEKSCNTSTSASASTTCTSNDLLNGSGDANTSIQFNDTIMTCGGASTSSSAASTSTTCNNIEDTTTTTTVASTSIVDIKMDNKNRIDIIKDELNKLINNINIIDIKANDKLESIYIYNKNNIEIKLNYTKNNTNIHINDDIYECYCYVITTFNKNLTSTINNYIFNCIIINNNQQQQYLLKLQHINNDNKLITTSLPIYNPFLPNNNNYLTQILLITNINNNNNLTTTTTNTIKLKYMICYTICNEHDDIEQDLISDTNYIDLQLY